MADDGDTSLPTAPPDAGRLGGLDDDLWRRVVVHLRRSLAEVPGLEDDPRLRRLRSLPVSRLLGGRARRDAVASLADGGPLWVDLRRRLLADPEVAGHVARALDDAAPDVAPPAPRPVEGADPAELDRLRERLRRLREARDDARRRAEGETARADREATAREQAEAALAEAQAEVARLRDALEVAADQRASAVERERRRGQASLAEVTEQLRQVRREHQERARRDRAAEQAQQARAARPTPRPREPAAPPRLVAGRPSRLPATVHPDTTEAVSLLLHAGRLVLVDGYNVSRTHRADLDLEGQRRWLVNLAAGAAATRRIEPRLVFDGHATNGPGSQRRDRGVVVVFTPEGVTADDDLVFEVEALDPARPVVVVTDDRELRDRLAGYGVDLVSTAGFLGAVR